MTRNCYNDTLARSAISRCFRSVADGVGRRADLGGADDGRSVSGMGKEVKQVASGLLALRINALNLQ